MLICRNEAQGCSSIFGSTRGKVCYSEALLKQGVSTDRAGKDNGSTTYGVVSEGCLLNVEPDDNGVPGPETPGMRPFVPRLKRIQEDGPIADKKDCSLVDSSKRVKLLQHSATRANDLERKCDPTSKFEWLDPSRIRDANGRSPHDPLYDKKTLYIPPDVLRKMSASQKQYWNIKSQYMDVLLFFKVVSLCKRQLLYFQHSLTAGMLEYLQWSYLCI